MGLFFKRGIIIFFSVLFLLIIGGVVVSYLFRNEVILFAIDAINERVNTRIEVQTVHFSLWRKFPNASVEFRNVEMGPAHDFDTLSFDPVYSRKLLSAGSVFIEMNLFRLLKKDFRISRIEIQDGKINMLTDKNNRHNFIFWKSSPETDTTSHPLELQNVSLHQVNVYYSHKKSNTIISLQAEKTRLNGKFSARQYFLTADWKGVIKHFSVDDLLFFRDQPFDFSGKLDVNDSIYLIDKSRINIAKIPVDVSGKFSAGMKTDLDLHVESNKLDLNSLMDLIPEKYAKQTKNYQGKGLLCFSGNIKGPAGKGKKPHVDIQFGLDNGQLTHRQHKSRLTGLAFAGSLDTGEKNIPATGTLRLNTFRCKMAGGSLEGKGSLQNFTKPRISLNLAGHIDMERFYDFFPANPEIALAGKATGNLAVSARLKGLSPAKRSDIDQLDIKGSLDLKDVSINLANGQYRIQQVNGTVNSGNRIDTDQLSLTLNGNPMVIKGYAEKLVPYLINREKSFHVHASVTSPTLTIDSLLAGNNSPSAGNRNTAPAFHLPGNITFDVGLKAGLLRYRDFEAGQLEADLSYRPTKLAIRSVSFSTMSGKAEGSGTITGRANNHIYVLGNMQLEKIDIRQMFRTFNNFSQDVIGWIHLKGLLSGNINFAIGWNDRMKLLKESVEVESDIEINGGELVAFEPLNNLSRFVALEELSNIHFSTLRTQLFVKDQQVVLPVTDIESSAFNISGSGSHYFDNSYTYHVKILLSELLAAKARKAKKENRDNEYVEDGKRTSLYLKVEGKGSDFKMSYDKKSARASIATDIKKEKQNLKQILQEEFGRQKKDSPEHQPDSPPNTGQLRFSFDEEDPKEEVNEPAAKNRRRKQEKKEEPEKMILEWE